LELIIHKKSTTVWADHTKRVKHDQLIIQSRRITSSAIILVHSRVYSNII
jgi:hypothetical protein